MSTIGYESWAVDLAEVGPIYPFQGSEVLMTVICVVFWLGWHVLQFRRESEHLESARDLGDRSRVVQSVERY